jgi:hypothetical protein
MSIEEQIAELYDLALENPDNVHYVLDLCQIDESLGSIILATAGVDVTHFWISIDNYGIAHAHQRHGNPTKEAKRGQIAIEKHHFIHILPIICNADNICYDVRNGKEVLIFEKELDGCCFVLKELRRVTKKGKQNRLMLQTFYIKKKTY